MSRRGIFVARVFGVRITVHPTWLFIFGLVVIWYGSAGGPVTGTVLTPLGRWIIAPIAAAAFFASVLIHELAHAFVARSRGMRVDEVMLFIFGGAARMDRDAPSASTELAVGLAGPVASAILGAVLVVVGTVLSGMTGVFEAVAAELAVGLGVVNLLLALFNLVPAFPMDGGRILRALLWSFTHDFERATRLATRLARGFGVVIIGAGLVIAFLVDPVAGLWAGLIGWFIYRAAEGDYRRVQLTRMMEGVVVRDVMDRDVAVVSPMLTLDTFIEQLLEDEAGLYPVTMDGGLVGTIDVEQVRRVPRSRWPTTRITDIMSRFETLSTLTEPQPVMDAVGRFQDSRVPAIAVVDGADPRHLLGLVTRDGLIKALRRREALRGN